MLASQRGQAGKVVRGVQAAGGTIRYRNDRLGYLRAKVLAGSVAKAANQAEVAAADIGEVIVRKDPAEPGTKQPTATGAPPGQTPDANPFLPTNEAGSVAFKQARGRDGRGVTIGVLDSGISTSATRRCRRPAPAGTRSSVPARRPIRCWTATSPGST